MKKSRFAVIGTNFITDRFLTAAALCPSFILEAVYSRTEKTGREFAQKHNCSKVYTSLESMVKDPDIDAVYIASPTAMHARHAMICLEGGKHVLCEKPLCSTGEQAEKLFAVAGEKGVLLAEAMRPLYTPAFGCLKELLPRIFPLRQVSLTFCQYSSRYDKFKAGIVENAFRPELSNGALMDIGSYCMAYLAELFGMPEKIQSTGWILPGSIDGCGTLVARYGDFLATVQYSKITRLDEPSVFMGEKGNLFIDQISAPRVVRLQLRGEEEQVFDFRCGLPDMYYEVRRFLTQITGEKAESKDPEIAFADHETASLVTMRILDEMRRQIGIVFPDDSYKL